MSTFEVTIEHNIEVLPHSNADQLELVRVGGYRAVVPKGEFKNGYDVVYIPEQAVLPDDLIEFIGLKGRLAGKAENRVKAIRLRGELSQGLVIGWGEFCKWLKVKDTSVFFALEAAEKGELAQLLDIHKWVPEVPAHFNGQIISAPDIIRWGDVENIKKFPEMFDGVEYVMASEKIHGTCCMITYVLETGDMFVSSKGFGNKSMAIQEDDNNIYWKAVKGHPVGGLLQILRTEYREAKAIGVFAEVYGEGIQDLGYGVPANGIPGLAVFDICIDNNYLTPLETNRFCHRARVTVPPVHYVGTYSYPLLAELANGAEEVSGKRLHMREGLVVRPRSSYMPHDTYGIRRIAKFVSEDYLLRKHGTEFE